MKKKSKRDAKPKKPPKGSRSKADASKKKDRKKPARPRFGAVKKIAIASAAWFAANRSTMAGY